MSQNQVKLIALTARQLDILREALRDRSPCSMRCDPSYAEKDKLISAITPAFTHNHVENSLAVRYVADVKEVGCDRPLALFEGSCGEHYCRPSAEFSNRFQVI